MKYGGIGMDISSTVLTRRYDLLDLSFHFGYGHESRN